jgi:hypothetical protein
MGNTIYFEFTMPDEETRNRFVENFKMIIDDRFTRGDGVFLVWIKSDDVSRDIGRIFDFCYKNNITGFFESDEYAGKVDHGGYFEAITMNYVKNHDAVLQFLVDVLNHPELGRHYETIKELLDRRYRYPETFLRFS